MIRSINSGALVRKPSRRADAAQLRERREMARGGGDKAGPLVSLTERGRERERGRQGGRKMVRGGAWAGRWANGIWANFDLAFGQGKDLGQERKD